MNKLQMAKAFAKLEGVDVAIMGDRVYIRSTAEEYNPFDYALNCKARDDYEVFIDYRGERVFVLSMLSEETSVDFEESGIPKAIIECILKSQGLYNATN